MALRKTESNVHEKATCLYCVRETKLTIRILFLSVLAVQHTVGGWKLRIFNLYL